MPLFHCAPIKLGAGSIIEPGNWGRLFDLHDWNDAGSVQRDFAELAMEYGRKTIRPEAPSRFNCVFCLEDEALARNYAQQFARQSVLHQVEPVEVDGQLPAQFRTMYSLIWALEREALSPLKALELNIQRYWQGNPDRDVEVLVGGPVRVVRAI
ncbi:hypothetical protein [Brucella pituitosa]|uniref:hypothetical protein n=1 Tax=Brucella pituitosa TaxID=571256 RepID=UPI0009A25060|nr:hypothetical protein [Brucella pituitosa]